MSEDQGLEITYAPSGRNGSATLTAKLGDQLLEVARVDLTKPKAREGFVDAICMDRPGIDRGAVVEELRRIAAEVVESGNSKRESQPKVGTPSSADSLAKMPETIRAEALAMLDDTNLMKRVIDDIATIGVAGERELTATTYLVGTSRLLDRPLSAITQGPSCSGKSYVIERVATLFPPETVLTPTQITPKALFYMPSGSLRHRFVAAGERSRLENDDTAEATRALREMQSSGKLSMLLTAKVDGQMQTKVIEQDGPIAYIESTTLSKIFDEDANRCILLNTDERPHQTRRIVEKLAAGYSGIMTAGDVERVVQRHHALQRMLEQRPIVIPYAGRLAELFDSDRVEVRRAFPQLMSMIQTVALLHQRQRQVDSDSRILANEDDYQLASHLLAKPLGRLLGGQLSDPVRRFYERMTSWADGLNQFTTTEADKKDNASRRAVTGWLSELCDAGVVEQLEQHKGNKPAVWRLTGVTPDDTSPDCGGLPLVKDVFGNSHFRHSDNEETVNTRQVTSA